MTSQPKQPDSFPPEVGLAPGASDLLVPRRKGAGAPEGLASPAPAPAGDATRVVGRDAPEPEADRASGRGGAAGDEAPEELDEIHLLDEAMTPPPVRAAPTELETAARDAASRETRRLAVSDVEPTRPNIVEAEVSTRARGGAVPDDHAQVPDRDAKPTVPYQLAPGVVPASSIGDECTEETLAISRRETKRLSLSDVEPTRPAIVNPELVRSSATVAPKGEGGPALAQSFDDEASELDLTKPAVPGRDLSSQPSSSPAPPVETRPVEPSPPVAPQAPPMAEPLEMAPARAPLSASPPPAPRPRPEAEAGPPVVVPAGPVESFIAPAQVPRGPADPDATAKLDGLPPFALLERLVKTPRDPDQTNRFVKRSSYDEPEGEVSSAPAGLSPVVVEPEHVIDRGAPTEQVARSWSAADRLDTFRPPAPGRGRQVSLTAFLGFNAVTLVIGFVVGALTVIVAVQQGIDLPAVPARWATDRADDAVERTAGLAPQAAATGAPAASADAAPGAGEPRVGDAGAAMVEGPAPVGTEAGLDLPDAFVVQVEFEPGRYQPEVVDQDELRRIAEAISRSQRMRVELVGHAVPLDGLAGDLARELALERAEAVAEQIRYHGPSRRRFSARPARVDEPMPEPRVPARPGKLHAVELRVVHR